MNTTESTQKKRILLGGAVITGLFFIFLAFSFDSSTVARWDQSVNAALVATPWVLQGSTFLHVLFETPAMIVLGTLITWSLWSTRRHRKALIFAGALMVNFGGIEALKAFIHRARPAEMLIAETSFSFPSGHAAIAVVFCGLVAALLLPKVKRTSLRILLAVAATLLALFTGVSRLYLHVHWASDVLAGMLWGSCVLCLALYFLEKKPDKQRER